MNVKKLTKYIVPFIVGGAITSVAISGCKSQSPVQKEIKRLEELTQLEEARTKYDAGIINRTETQIENIKNIKDKLYELEDNFYDLNEKRVKRTVIQKKIVIEKGRPDTNY